MFDKINKGQWWDFGWQLVEGCTPISAGCEQCWSLAKEKRFRKETGIVCHSERLERPLKRRKPASYAIWNDLFHEEVPFDFIRSVFETVANAGQHAYQFLTKRADRMKEFFQSCEDWDSSEWPNVHIGVTCENQEMADKRIPILLQIPVAVRFISIEPCLGNIDIEKYLDLSSAIQQKNTQQQRSISWCVVGSESGTKRRPCKIEWIRSIVEQCKAGDVPVFVKQIELLRPIPWSSKVSHNMSEWPEDLRLREYPKC